MDSNQWQKVKELFNTIHSMEPESRNDYLDNACKGQPEIRKEVEALLDSNDETGAFLRDTTRCIVPHDVSHEGEEKELAGDRIGQYRLNRVISSGGMGTVYEATQDSPQRTVAIKVLRLDIASRTTLRRFEYESQILARLTHPNIAQVIEAGTHIVEGREPPSKIPYFVMEYVDSAKPVTDYAREEGLSTKARIRLFLQICEAVQHGHQKGIIHRDLKPSNLLVNASGQVKVIDFGIARATDPDMAKIKPDTLVGSIVGTPQYMSPEQCRMNPDELDVRSDVYTLGLVLYELLCEGIPYEVHPTAAHRALNVICESKPKKPSAFDVALKGDMETILLKALEKNRSQRYPSAMELAEDLRRHLRGEVTLARPVGRMTRSWKAVKRNPVVSSALGAGLAAIVASVCYVLFISYPQLKQERDTVKREKERAVAAEQKAVNALEEVSLQRMAALEAKEEAEQESKKTRMINNFLNDMLAAPNPYEDGREVKVVDVLDEAAGQVEGAFPDQPEIEAELRHTLGWTYKTLGQYEEAETHLRAAATLSSSELGPEHPDTLYRNGSLTVALVKLGMFEEAFELIRSTFETQQRVLGETHPHTLDSLLTLATCHTCLGRVAETEALQRKALALQIETLGSKHKSTMQTRSALAFTWYKMGKYVEAEPMLREVYEHRRKVYGENDLNTINVLYVLSVTMARLGKAAEAETHSRTLFEVRCRALGEDHPNTIHAMAALALACYNTGKHAETERLFRDTVAKAKRVLGEENPQTMVFMNNLVGILGKLGKLEEAKPIVESLYTIQSRALGNEHPDTLSTAHNLAMILYEEGELSAAEENTRKLIETRRRVLVEHHPHTLMSIKLLADIFRDLKRYDEALPLYEECLTFIRGGGKVRESWEAETFASFGIFLMRTEQFGPAEKALLEGYDRYHEKLGENHEMIVLIKRQLIKLYEEWGKEAEATVWRGRLTEK